MMGPPFSALMSKISPVVVEKILTHLNEKAGSTDSGLLPQVAAPPQAGLFDPAVSEKRLSLTPSGNAHYELKTPYRDGTTHVIFEPLDFIARLAALVPKPRVNLTRFHGVFAPNSKHRVQVTPAKRGKGKKTKRADEPQDPTPAERRASMSWAQRLKRVFMRYIPVPHPYGAAYGCANRLSCRFVNIDIETCSACGGAVKVIACIRLQGCRR